MEARLVKTVILGHAVGDALGVPVEFWPREKLAQHPVKDMLGFGTLPVPQGSCQGSPVHVYRLRTSSRSVWLSHSRSSCSGNLHEANRPH